GQEEGSAPPLPDLPPATAAGALLVVPTLGHDGATSRETAGVRREARATGSRAAAPSSGGCHEGWYRPQYAGTAGTVGCLDFGRTLRARRPRGAAGVRFAHGAGASFHGLRHVARAAAAARLFRRTDPAHRARNRGHRAPVA